MSSARLLMSFFNQSLRLITKIHIKVGAPLSVPLFMAEFLKIYTHTFPWVQTSNGLSIQLLHTFLACNPYPHIKTS
eukprot:UN24925